ncbi:hypothetical protein Tco_1548220 [Tanacetum coccineum]
MLIPNTCRDEFDEHVSGQESANGVIRFGVEYWVDYNNEDDLIPFRKRVFSSAKDGILQFVLLGLEDRRGVPDWILRLANDRDGWDKYPWVPSEFDREFKEQKRVVDQLMKKDAERENMYEQGGASYFRTQANNSFFEGAQAIPSYGHNMAMPNWQTPMPSYLGTSNWQSQMPSRSATLNWQTPMPSQPGTSNFAKPDAIAFGYSKLATSYPIASSYDGGLLNLREVRPSMYRRTPYMDLPSTTVVPKKRGDKTKNKVKNANVSPLNLGNAFADDNVGGDDVMFLGERDTGRIPKNLLDRVSQLR